MNRNLEQGFTEQAGQLFAKCRAYIGIDEAMPQEAKAALQEEITAAWEALDVDFDRLFEEITGNLEEPMSEQQRERYCFSLITPFKEYSCVLFPVWEIAKYKESLARAKNEGKENLAELYTNLIAAAEARAERYKKMAFTGKYKPVDEAEKVYRKLAQRISDYGRILDAAFVLSGLDLKRLQDRCAVYINDFSIPDRAKQIGEIIGSEALALEYLNKLPKEKQKQPRRKAGRPTEPFTSKMIDDADGRKLTRMHTILDGKTGKDFALLIWAFVTEGWCNNPTYTQVTKEFGYIGSKEGYNRYRNSPTSFSEEEKKGALACLEEG